MRGIHSPSARRAAFARRAAALAVAAGLALPLAACANDPLAEQYRAGENTGFIANEFAVQEIPVQDRGEPVEFAATTENGDPVSSADFAGDVLVVNFWYAACGPCRAEAPALEEAHAALAGEDAAFLGLNLQDSAAGSLAFAETYGVEYPSMLATEDGSVKLAFAGQVPLTAVPSTLVLDREGRVAARIIGQLSEASVLETLVRDALDES